MKYLVLLFLLMGCDDECVERTACRHIPSDELVPIEECGFARTPVKNNEIDPRDSRRRPYFRTGGDYERVEVCD